MQPTGRKCPGLRPRAAPRWDAAERRFVRAARRWPAADAQVVRRASTSIWMHMAVREYCAPDDLPAVRMCLIELQEFERALDPRVPPGATIADAYLDGLFRRCDQLAGQLFVAEAD